MPVLTFIIAQTDSQQRNSKILEDMPKMHLKENGGMEQEGHRENPRRSFSF
jgi:hypothetical protein